MKTNEIYEFFAARTPCMHEVWQSIPWRQTCWGCRPKEVGGLNVRAYFTTDGYCVGFAKTDENLSGFPEVTHGGVIAAYFDEVLWNQTKRESIHIDAMTVHEEVDFFKPVPEGSDVTIVALPLEKEGRHFYAKGALLLSDGSIAATGKVHYIRLKTDSEISAEEKKRILNPSDAVLTEVFF